MMVKRVYERVIEFCCVDSIYDLLIRNRIIKKDRVASLYTHGGAHMTLDRRIRVHTDCLVVCMFDFCLFFLQHI